MNHFQKVQAQFSASLRNPSEATALEGVEPRRMKVYQELFFNNVKGFVEQAFPVLRSIWGEERIHQEVKLFWQHYSCESPYFIHISRSFLNYLINEREPQPSDLPFLLELAHYEWVELDISTRHSEQFDRWLEPEQVNQKVQLILSDLALPLQYQYPVHQISPSYQPQQLSEQGIFLVVYRNAQCEVKFLEVNGVTAKLLELIGAQPKIRLEQLSEQLSEFMPHYPPADLNRAVTDVITQLAERGIVRQSV